MRSWGKNVTVEERENKRLLRCVGWFLVILFFVAMGLRNSMYVSRGMDITFWLMLIGGIILIRMNRAPPEDTGTERPK